VSQHQFKANSASEIQSEKLREDAIC
jgi:hypothetical protein